jgi:Domain of unknown function (DUF4328)
MSDYNPYESPQAIEPPQSRQPAWSRGLFRSGHTRAVFAMALLGLMAAVNFGNIYSNWLQYQLLDQVKHGKKFSEATLLANDARHATVVMAELIGLVLTAIAFLMWIHRAYSNLPALGARNLETSPGWAVGWYFVPIANLVKPYSTMVEIVRHSNPQGIGINARATSTAIVGFWWLFYLAQGVIGSFAAMTVKGGIETHSIDAMMNGTEITMAGKILSIVAALIAILVVMRVDKEQDERFKLVSSQEGGQGQGGPSAEWL